MSEFRDLLIEIGTEELPPKALQGLSEAFSSGVCKGLDLQTLPYPNTRSFATPRRLAILIQGLATGQADRETERRGPAIKAIPGESRLSFNRRLAAARKEWRKQFAR